MNQIVLPETGATIKPGPMITVVPGRTITDEQLAHIGGDSGLNGPFLADQMSAWVTHQRMGSSLYRMLAGRTANPVYQAMFTGLSASCAAAVTALEALVGGLGGNPQYASPMARMTEGLDTKLVEAMLLPGSADPLTLETAGLMTGIAAMTLALVHAETLEKFADEAAEGDVKQALTSAAEEVLPVCRAGLEQLRQAHDKAVILQVKHPLGQKIMQGLEKVTAAAKDALR